MGKTGRPTPHNAALQVAMACISELLDNHPVVNVEVCGSIRRMQETVNDVDLMVVTRQPQMPIEMHRLGYHVTAKQANKWYRDVWVEAWWCPFGSDGPCRLFLTGPGDLNVYMRRQAQKRGLKLNQYGLTTASGDRLDENSEVEVFDLLGMPYLEPVDRQNWKEYLDVRFR